MAVPLRTPPETGLRIGFGPGVGGGSESSITRISSAVGLTAGALRSTGPEAILVAVAEAEGSSVALGTFLLSRCLFAAVGLSFVSAGFVRGAGDGVTGWGVVAAPGVTIFTMFSSR